MSDLVLSDYERGYLTAYYDTVVFDAMADCCDEDWFGVRIGDRMFDLNAWADEDTGKLVCVVYDCIWVNDNWRTNTVQNGWILTEENDTVKSLHDKHMNCYNCNTKLKWGSDFDIDHENEYYSMMTALHCPNCKCDVEVYYPKENDEDE